MARRMNRTLPLKLPGLEVFGHIGSGRRVHAYRARWQNRNAVVKRYTPDSERRCRRIYARSLAQFEYQRNREFHEIDTLRRYCAEPLACLQAADGEWVLVQEYIDGQSLKDYIVGLGHLPARLFETGKFIVREAERHNIHDLDLPAANLKVVSDEDGPRPVVFDFNLIPQHHAPPNPFLYLLYKIGYRKPSHRDYRAVHRWLDLAPLK